MTDFTAGIEQAMKKCVEKLEPLIRDLSDTEASLIQRAFIDGVAHGLKMAGPPPRRKS